MSVFELMVLKMQAEGKVLNVEEAERRVGNGLSAVATFWQTTLFLTIPLS